eukprot:2665222-Rhodomonas_salina.1
MPSSAAYQIAARKTQLFQVQQRVAPEIMPITCRTKRSGCSMRFPTAESANRLPVSDTMLKAWPEQKISTISEYFCPIKAVAQTEIPATRSVGRV